MRLRVPGMRRVVGVVRQQRRRALPTIVVVLMVLGVSCAGGERAASDRAPEPAIAPVADDGAVVAGGWLNHATTAS